MSYNRAAENCCCNTGRQGLVKVYAFKHIHSADTRYLKLFVNKNTGKLGKGQKKEYKRVFIAKLCDICNAPMKCSTRNAADSSEKHHC